MTPRATLRLMVGLIRRERARWLVNVVAWSVIWTMPLLAGVLIAAYFDRLELDRGPTVTTLVLLFLAYGLGRIVAVVLAMHNDANFVFRVGAVLQSNMLHRILGRPGAQATDTSTGEIVTRFRDDVEHVRETATWTVDLAGSLSFAVVASVVLWNIDAAMTLAVFLPLVLVVWIAERMGARLRRYRELARRATGRVTEAIGEAFGSVQAIKVAGAEGPVGRHIQELNRARKGYAIKDKVLDETIESMFHNTVSIGVGLVLLMAASRLGSSLTLGEFALFVFVMGMATETVTVVGLFIARLRQASVSFARMHELLGDEPQLALVAPVDAGLGRGGPAPLPAEPEVEPLAAVEIEGLTFRYPSSGEGIEDVHLRIERGSFTVVTGRIGSGKTTLLRAILGLVDADAGKVRWNDEVVADPASFLAPPRAAYTPQVPRLFSMSLRDNLLLGLERNDGELVEAIAAAQLEPDLAEMPQGLDTEVGPLGVRLSGGQVQRAAAARMLVRRPELLVFDDLSSALDVDTEQKLWERLLAADGEVTSLVVSHRRPALRRADQIVVMKDGRVDAIGTLEELLPVNAELQRMWAGK